MVLLLGLLHCDNRMFYVEAVKELECMGSRISNYSPSTREPRSGRATRVHQHF